LGLSFNYQFIYTVSNDFKDLFKWSTMTLKWFFIVISFMQYFTLFYQNTIFIYPQTVKHQRSIFLKLRFRECKFMLLKQILYYIFHCADVFTYFLGGWIIAII
jgi:hypothetical protein